VIYDSKGKVRLTRSEENTLRKYNALNGDVLGPIETSDDYRMAVIGGLPSELVDDMIAFLETGTSPLHRQGLAERVRDK